jgi:hypothetical protein
MIALAVAGAVLLLLTLSYRAPDRPRPDLGAEVNYRRSR